jgi:chloride channel protein, CIC family
MASIQKSLIVLFGWSKVARWLKEKVGSTKVQKLFSQLGPISGNARSILQTSLLGLAAGLTAVAFHLGTSHLFALTYLNLLSKPKTTFILSSIFVMLGFSLIVALMLRWIDPTAAGSGIPQMKAAYWKDMGYIPFKTVMVKFITGILSIAGGNSLGREGPSVFVASGTASGLAGLMGVRRHDRRGAAAIGAAAGLAAAFNTPLAAITFVIEELIGDLNSRHLGRVVLAAMIGAFSVHAIIGRQPAFYLPSVENVSWVHYLVVPLVAVVATSGGILFQRWSLGIRRILRRQKVVAGWLLPIAGGLLTWAVGIAVFLICGRIGVFGLGYQDLSSALTNQFPWKVAGLLFLAKLAATIFSYSFGGSGGIFAPALFIGGMVGFFIAGMAGLWLPLTSADHIVLAAVGMSACLGAIVHAPLTSVLIVFEMTHQFELVPGLMLGIVISQALAHRFNHLNFYDALLAQDGHELHKVRPPLDLQGWRNLQIKAVANPRPVFLCDFSKEAMQQLLERYPYAYFPVMSQNQLCGVTSRLDIASSIASGQRPKLHEAVICRPDQTIQEASQLFVTHSVPLVLVGDPETRTIMSLLSLHDLIRAQAAIQA